MTTKTLPDLVRAERAKLGLSIRQVADRSGGKLSSTTVHAIEQGSRATYDDRTLIGLAEGLSIPADVVVRAAGLALSDENKPFTLPKRADRLTRKERDHVLELIDLLLARRSR